MHAQSGKRTTPILPLQLRLRQPPGRRAGLLLALRRQLPGALAEGVRAMLLLREGQARVVDLACRLRREACYGV